ncbi:hypothetical protein WOLCODRAFT_140049 [Wolfiporia cocos MD-104 SS10]|uniref:Uncharacterized protein n=1 Tax=Wolfiporia cocos (strain MD-104) TaxID=742152 RepID=A0A2H3J182_WOLCO|nr:hypothetical protein WOLCODRAFT_140049 [Wolfiporia cocos MD-104 SS10]
MPTESADYELDAHEWVIIPRDWWKNSYRTVQWTYLNSERQRRPRHLRTPCIQPLSPGSGIHARPPHYHDHLLCRRMEEEEGASQEDLELNPSLAGVRVAEEALRPYECDVGIDRPQIDSKPPHNRRVPSDGSPEDAARALWHDMVQALLGSEIERPSTSLADLVDPCSEPRSKVWDLTALDSALSSPSVPDLVDLTDSEVSVESDPLPATPRGAFTQIAPVPNKPLNASALSFTPSTPTPSPPSVSSSRSSLSPTHEFAFPSLHADNPAASPAARRRSLLLQKDGDGFYHPVDGPTDSHTSTRSTTPRRPSADLLPAFLADGTSASRTRARNASRTREIVDRLRSGRWTGKKAGGKSGKETGDHADPGAHTNRARSRDANAAAGPARREAQPDARAAGVRAPAEGDGWVRGPAADTADDGWIAGPAAPPAPPGVPATPAKAHRRGKQSHRRSPSTASTLSVSGSSGASFSPATPASTFSVNLHTPPSAAQAFPPPPPLVPLAPFPAAPAYAPAHMTHVQAMQMQVQMQMQAQQWQTYKAAQFFGGAPAYVPYHPAGPLPVVAGQPAAFNAKGMGLLGVQ